MTEPTREENIAAGMERIEELVGQFDEDLLDGASDSEFADRARKQPWLIAGVSDGMGLRVTLAAIEAGLVERGVGVYFEPPALMELDSEGKPLSPVHWARYQNALALEEYAAEKGVDFEVLQSDMILAPQRGLKGDVKGEPPDFPEDVRESFNRMRDEAPVSDAVFIDSVAFGKWICPREGNDAVEVPSVDFEGQIVSTKTKKYHVRGYEETLDTMGRNHGRLLEKMREFGWLGDQALTAFFTWAGGSQNVEVLEGIYGRGSLGDAKIIAEKDVVEFRLEHGRDLGDHAIVRLPAFLSAALMAIPGGGLFGLVSRKTLQDKGVYRDMPELAIRMLRRLFDTEWVRNNPIAQLELDSNEVLHLPEISSKVEEAHREIEAYREKQAEDKRTKPIPPEKSAELLEGFVPWNYRQILGRFRPEDEGAGESDFEMDRVDGPFRESFHAPVADGFAAALAEMREMLDASSAEGEATWIRDRFEAVDSDGEGARIDESSTIRGFVRLEGVGSERVTFSRTLYGDDGRRIGEGETIIGFDSRPSDDDDEWLGEPAGSRFDIDESASDAFLDADSVDFDAFSDALALSGFAESSLLASGRVGAPSLVEWECRFDDLKGDSSKVLTYARRDGDAVRASVVGDDEPVFTLVYRDRG